METPFDRDRAMDRDRDDLPMDSEDTYTDRDLGTRDRPHQAGGAMDNLGGKIQEAAGNLTGNEQWQEEGRAKQMQGDVDQGYGVGGDRLDETSQDVIP